MGSRGGGGAQIEIIVLDVLILELWIVVVTNVPYIIVNQKCTSVYLVCCLFVSQSFVRFHLCQLSISVALRYQLLPWRLSSFSPYYYLISLACIVQKRKDSWDQCLSSTQKRCLSLSPKILGNLIQRIWRSLPPLCGLQSNHQMMMVTSPSPCIQTIGLTILVLLSSSYETSNNSWLSSFIWPHTISFLFPRLRRRLASSTKEHK